MVFDELKKNVAMMFKREDNETADAYAFYLKEALAPFSNRPGDLTPVWESIKEYDGMKKRANWAFFKKIAAGTKTAGSEGFVYYQCNCGEKLSMSSDGGCVNCRKPGAVMKRVKEPVQVTRCQGSCFDCSIYSNKQIGPTCNEFGTPGYDTCQMKNKCSCQACCRFEWKRTYHPDALRQDYPEVLQTLPPPLSAAGLAFHEGRASFSDLIPLLTRKRL